MYKYVCHSSTLTLAPHALQTTSFTSHTLFWAAGNMPSSAFESRLRYTSVWMLSALQYGNRTLCYKWPRSTDLFLLPTNVKDSGNSVTDLLSTIYSTKETEQTAKSPLYTQPPLSASAFSHLMPVPRRAMKVEHTLFQEENPSPHLSLVV